MRSTISLSLGLIALASFAAAPASAQSYNFVTFDPVAGQATTVNGISNTGAAVGFTGASSNFIRNPDGTTTMLTALNAGAFANGINSGGDVVGADGTNAFFLPGGGASETFINVPGALSTVAFGINDSGTIVGQYAASATTSPGFVYSPTTGFQTFQAQPAGAVTTFVQGISDNGLAVGFYSSGGPDSHGFTYNTLTGARAFLRDPNDPNFAFSQVLGINDAGIAAGYYGVANGSQFGFLYNTKTLAYTFLNDPLAAPNGNGVQVTQITGINNAGEIAGFYVDANGGQHGFVATPTVPEASSLSLLGLGILALPLLRARRRTA